MPMVILWGLAGTAVAAYYLLPVVAGALKVFADWQIEYGKAASFVDRFVCGGLLPGVFLLTMPSIRPKRAVVTVLAQAVWNGLMGMMTDVFFAWQGVWFGSEPSLKTVILKALHDAVFDYACDQMRKGTKPIELPGLLGHYRLTLDRIFLARTEKTVFEWRKTNLRG